MYELTKERRESFQKLLKTRILKNHGYITHVEIAKQVGVSQSTISYMLRGPTPGARFIELVRLGSWAGVSPNELAEALGLWVPVPEAKENP
jgi:hypothetical protein